MSAKSLWNECSKQHAMTALPSEVAPSKQAMATAELIANFKKRLARHLDYQLDLVVNENRSTMIRVLERKKAFARLSLHRMFLDAPEEILSEIASFVEGKHTNTPKADYSLRGYIQSNLARFNYSHLLDRTKLVTQGEHYDIQAIYNEINRDYFGGTLKLVITWYGARGRKNRSRIVFGEYFDHLRLVKIHRVLDDPFFPDYFVRYVVYHEMLHHVVPGYVNKVGHFRAHGADFKAREREFKEYERAIAWERLNKAAFFTPRVRRKKRTLLSRLFKSP